MMIMQEIGALAGALGIGLSLGLVGAGGSILTIPVFVYVLKIDPLASAVYSMFVVGIASAAGSLQFLANRLVDLKIILLFGCPSLLAAMVARHFLFPMIPDHLVTLGPLALTKAMMFMLALAALMLMAAMSMLRPQHEEAKEMPERTFIVRLLLRGLTVGIITGLLGVGGGFLVVPALYFWAGLPMKKSIGTALLIISVNCLFSFWYCSADTQVDWVLIAKFSLVAVAGILAGSRLSRKIRSENLRKIFGCFILCTAVYIIARTIIDQGS